MSNHLHMHAEAPAPPLPPPLPPQRQGFVANAFARVAQPFGYGSRPPSATGHRPADPRAAGSSVQRGLRWADPPSLPTILETPKVPEVPPGSNEARTDVQRSPISSRSTFHKTGIPIAALDISPNRTHAVLAGHNILKTIQVSESACAEDINLRTSIIAYAATHEASTGRVTAKHKDQWTANDVKWSHGQYDTTIATAAANGQIVVYDINRAGIEIARLHEHNRQVHKLGFNPHGGQLMLSGSQDGTVRLWDLRDLSGDRSVTTCQSRRKFSGNSEGIRDLRWSPTDGLEFALGTDNGIIQRWDIRNEKTPLLRISAHENKTCYSIDWHPDGKHLISGGADKNIKVWDFSSSDRRKKHIWEIRAPHAVLNVRWRPACWSSEFQRPAKWQCTQVATSYDQQNPQIQIWDFRRPHMPFRVSDRYETPASTLLWHSESLLWSVGSAGIFTQTDTKFLPKTMDHRSSNLVTIAADGKILFFSQKKERRRTSIEDVLDDLKHQSLSRSSIGDRPSPKANTTNESLEEPNLLSSSFKKRQRKVTAPTRSTRSSTGTPPSASSPGSVINLEKSLLPKNMHRSSQVAGIGYIPGLFDAPAFRFLARNYKIPRVPDGNVECDLHTILADALRYNGNLAARVSQHRLSQSFEILALAVEKELNARAESSYQRRTKAARPDAGEALQHSEAADLSEQHDSKRIILNDDLRRQRATDSSILENTSNVTTPLARPIPDTMVVSPAPSNVESLQLPETTWSKQPVKSAMVVSELAKLTSPKSSSKEEIPARPETENTHSESFNETQRPLHDDQLPRDAGLVHMDRQMAERRATMDNYRAIPRPVLRLDDPIQMTGSSLDAPTFDRHDSNESYQMFSASTDSSHRVRSIMGSFESGQESQEFKSTLDQPSVGEDHQGRGDVENEESALVSDKEAQLHSPGHASASPSEDLHSPRKDEVERPSAYVEQATSHSPAEYQQPIVHDEDFEPWPDQANHLNGHLEERPSDNDHKYILSDFYPPDAKPENLLPWFASSMLDPLIDYHTQQLYDAQLPTYLFLHIARWLNHSFLYEHILPIFLQYHRQLVDLDLVVQAAELRKLAGSEFPEVAEYGLYGIAPGGPLCTVCRKPNKGDKPRFCERCNNHWGECPVCNGLGPLLPPDRNGVCRPAENSGAGSLWGWCQECGHGGHMACLSIFWDDHGSEGACPTLGCLHDCMPGERRDEIVARLEKEREKTQPGVVSKDEWKVPESAAAQRARGLMGRTSSPGLGMAGGRGPLSLAAAGRSGSGGKRVRIVVPGDEAEEGEEAQKGKGKGKERASASTSIP